jgi:hypothetical protein
MLACIDRSLINYTLCVKKLSVLQKYSCKEEWLEEKDTTLQMSELWQAVSKQKKAAEIPTKDIY